MGYDLREHTADIAVEATGETLGGAFGATADGMAAAMCEEWPATGDRFEITVEAENREALLFDYLDELIYKRDMKSVLPVGNEGLVSVTPDTDDTAVSSAEVESAPSGNKTRWRFEGSYRGVPLLAVSARDLKAVTYADMDIQEIEGGFRIYVVFDV